MKNIFKHTLLAAAVLALASLTGCGGNGGSSTADTPAAADSTESAAVPEDSVDEQPDAMPDDNFDTDSTEGDTPQDTPADRLRIFRLL